MNSIINANTMHNPPQSSTMMMMDTTPATTSATALDLHAITEMHASSTTTEMLHASSSTTTSIVSDDDDASIVSDLSFEDDAESVQSVCSASSTSMSMSDDCLRFHPSQRRSKHASKKRIRQQVRFQTNEETSSSSKDCSVIKKAGKKVKKMIRSRNIKKSNTWYTREEIKDSFKSIIMAVSSPSSKIRRRNNNDQQGLLPSRSQKIGEDGTTCSYTSSWFSQPMRKQRQLRRTQMYKILQAVQAYESATQTKVPDMLSQLLDRHSKSMVQEAIQIASTSNTNITSANTSVASASGTNIDNAIVL